MATVEFSSMREHCTSITCSDFLEVVLPVAAVYGLVLAIGIVRMLARRRPRVLLSLPRQRGR